MRESWENVWADRDRGGRLHRVGSALAALCDLQYIVFGEIRNHCVLEGSPGILEVGCGTAPVLRMLEKHTRRLYGIDIAPSAAAEASRTCAASVADGRSLPFGDSVFGIVFSTGVLDLYDLQETGAFMKEMKRVLRKGGRAVITTASSSCALHRRIMERLVKKGEWIYGPKRGFSTLAPAVPEGMRIVGEHRRGAVFQLRFVSFLFRKNTFLRRLYNGFFLGVSLVLRPLNRLPGALLVTVLEKE